MGMAFQPTDKKLKILLAAGGTGGHLFPALTLAREIKKMRPHCQIAFVVSGRSLEKDILAQEGFQLFTLKSQGFKGAGLWGKCRSLLLAFQGIFEARRLIKSYQPSLCFGAGAYLTGPVGVAAKICGVPLVIHEANSRPGLTNKILGRLAKVVLLGFAEAKSYFKSDKVVLTGNPVREEIARLHESEKNFAGPPVILITGGSQGARAINKAAMLALVHLKDEGLEFEAFHQCGANDLKELEAAYQAAEVKVRVASFFDNMAEIYRKAHLVISRGGASTISELAMAKLPSFLIPLPTAADDHQTANARYLTEPGGAILIEQKNLSGLRLGIELASLLSSTVRLERMSQAAGKKAMPGAEKKMAACCLELIDNQGKAR